MNVELAPRHKVGLPLRHPLLLAQGTVEILALCDRRLLGAVVASEVGGKARQRRRLLARPGGFLSEEGPGVLSWSGLRDLLRAAGDLPVIGRVRGRDARGAARAAARLEAAGVSALQVDLLPGERELAQEVMRAVREACELPLLAQVPLEGAVVFARAAEEAGADALVVAAPPQGLAVLDDPASPQAVEVHGPLVHPLALLAVQQVAESVTIPIVARGGITGLAGAQAFLAQGAVAVAVDSLATVRPAAVAEIGRGLQRARALIPSGR